MQEFIEVTKLALRDQVLAARRHLPLSVIGERARALADHLMETPELRQAATVAAYVSVSSEPGTGPLLDRLHAAGKRVILPLLRADNDLDWGAYDGPDGLRTARRGLLEPAGPPLGPEALTRQTWSWSPASPWAATVSGWVAAAGPTTGRWLA